MRKNSFLIFWVDNYLFQYSIIAICCFALFALFHFGSHTSFENIQSPEGVYKNNIWSESDFMSYYKPAVNYIEYGTFGVKDVPDCFRTIGYPFFLAIMIKCFGNNWLYWTYAFNCITMPFIFLALYYISNALFNRNVARIVFISSFFLGVYFGKVICIGTDLFFILFFITGIFFLVKYFYESKKVIYILFYLVFISLAAQIRPSLIYFAFINVAFFYYLNTKFYVITKGKGKLTFLICTTILLLFTTNLPSIRNYSNYGFFKPSTVLETNYFEYLARKILAEENLSFNYDSLKTIVDRESNYARRMDLQTNFTKETVKKYPKSFIKIIYENVKNVMFDNGITNQIANYFGYNWKRTETFYPSELLYIIYFVYIGLYSIIYCLFLFKLWLMIKEKEWIHLAFILLIISIMLFPTFISGSGGARHRMAVEWLILMYASDGILCFKKCIQQLSCDGKTRPT
jgi:hypothetical protein